ncbi:MAG TPA: aspartate aminotransferase family protein [Bacteroidia bacterium]|nr:aspartate aminotransferase family protein [Bacteroidia bacterium]
MITDRQLFLQHLAPTSDAPLALEIKKAKGIYLFDAQQKKYMDLISGISVSNIGHLHPKVVNAVKKQLDKYMHLMVYGEYIQSPQVQLAKKISDVLPKNLSCCYFVNSGSEAVEGALKLAKRYTNRSEIISFKNAYHGSSQGAMSVMGNEEMKNAYRPLLPNIRFLEINNLSQLEFITKKTACVIIEPIQGEAGVIESKKNFLKALRKKCSETETLLIFDEIQTGFGRTGIMFAFQHVNIIPDIILLGKAMGGGIPIGAFVSSKKIMKTLSENPVLGHITTFGGHPVSCAAALANLEVITSQKNNFDVLKKEKLFRTYLKHSAIKSIRGKGLLLAIEFDSFEINKKIIDRCIKNGIITDWFLFCPEAMRIAPPLIITEKEIKLACKIIMESIAYFFD